MSFVRKRLNPRLLVVYALAGCLIWFAEPRLTGLLLGGGLVIAGEALRVWATGHLHKNDDLTVSGPYRFLRHPLYLGTLLVACGFAAMGPSWMALGAFALFLLGYAGYYMPYKDRIESARLESLYGDAFRRYATAVPTLLPRFHPYTPLGSDLDQPIPWRAERFSDNNEMGTGVVVGLGLLGMVLRWSLL